MYDIPIKQKKSTKLTLKEEENRLELIKKENVDKIHNILINSKNLYEDLSILYPNLKGNRHLMMTRTINDLYRNKSLQNILFGEEFDSIKDDNAIVATGGEITDIVDSGKRYIVHTFTSSGNFELISDSVEVEYMVVAGGGGAHYNCGGGGGAGEMIETILPVLINKNTYPVVIGAGGNFGNASQNSTNGSNSSFNNIVANGGGRGGGGPIEQLIGSNGGSGGGSSHIVTSYGLSVKNTYPNHNSYGNNGGTISGTSDGRASSGGGAGSSGNAATTTGANGGLGKLSKIDDKEKYYAGGGASRGASGFGIGGSNIGGDGSTTKGGTGVINTGSGGGGGGTEGGNGGSGIVIIRYEVKNTIIDNLFKKRVENNLDNHIVNSHTDIIGVQDNGTRSSNGAGLRQVIFNNSKLDLTTKDTAYFDNHRSYRFSDYYDNTGNAFVKIPISYWWRGMLPDVVDGTTPRWTMLLSPYPITKTINGVNCTFTASPSTFNHNTKGWLPHFYIGKYRGHNAGDNKVGSKAGQTAWSNISFNNFRTYCSNNGEGYHMLSLFEWHEILARMVIEKCTFQLLPEATRATQASCIYRGINDFAFGPTTGVCAEWMDGIRIDASGNFEIWNTSDGNYISTGKSCIVYTGESDYYCQSLYSEIDNLFISATNGANATSFIPDLAGMKASGLVSKVCSVHFNSPLVRCGAFVAHFYYSSADANTGIGCRLSKW